MASNNTVVPPAPLLKFPIALKACSKTVSTVDQKPKARSQRKNNRVRNAVSKQDLSTIYAWALSLNGGTQFDIRNWSRSDRTALLDGPNAPLVANTKVIGEAPLRLVLAASAVVRSEFLSTHKVPSICVNHHALGDALFDLVNYLKSTLTKRDCYWLTNSPLAHDMDLILAAECTGFDAYTSNIRNFWWGYLKSKPVEVIGYENMEALEIRMVPETKDFAMIKMVIKHLAHLWYHYEIANIPETDAWLETHPNMRTAVNKHVENWDARNAEKEAAHQTREQAKKDAFAEQLRVARGGRAGGYGM